MGRGITPDDRERDEEEDAPVEREDDDFEDDLDTRPEDEDEDPEDYTWPGEEGGQG